MSIILAVNEQKTDASFIRYAFKCLYCKTLRILVLSYMDILNGLKRKTRRRLLLYHSNMSLLLISWSPEMMNYQTFYKCSMKSWSIWRPSMVPQVWMKLVVLPLMILQVLKQFATLIIIRLMIDTGVTTHMYYDFSLFTEPTNLNINCFIKFSNGKHLLIPYPLNLTLSFIMFCLLLTSNIICFQ